MVGVPLDSNDFREGLLPGGLSLISGGERRVGSRRKNDLIMSHINPWAISKICAGSLADTTEVEFSSGERRLRASVPSGELWGSIKDILVYEEYELLRAFSCASLKGGSIVDVGAQVGLYTLKAAPFARRVFSFEPSSTNFGFLKRNVERNSLLNVQVHQTALWSSTGRVRFTDGGAGFVSELGGVGGDYEVDTTTLDAVVAEVGRVDLLKIDVEGAEYDVFPACSDSTLRRIEKIVAEVHVFAPDHLRRLDGILHQLKDSGFNVSIRDTPFQTVTNGVMKPWRSPLRSCNGKSAALYRALLSAVYGAAPVLKRVKASIDIGTQSLLFAYRTQGKEVF
jgi:FkbM family methyltransferase